MSLIPLKSQKPSRNRPAFVRRKLLAVLVVFALLGLGSLFVLRPQAALGSTHNSSQESRLQQDQPSVDLSKLTNGPGGTPQDAPFILTGNAVTWTYNVTNTGNADLTNVTITDDAGTPADPADDIIVCALPALAIGVSSQCTGTGTAREGQYTNNATVLAWFSPTETVTDSDASSYFGASPAVTIQKFTNGDDADTAPGPSLTEGTTVNWSYVVSNEGNVSLTGVAVTDNPPETITCPKTTLAPDESITCTASGIAQVGQFSNVATVVAVPPVGPNVSDTDPSHYLGIEATRTQTVTGTPPTPTVTGTITPNPTITVSVNPTSARVNQTLTFSIRVTNPGTAPARNAVVSDVFPSYVDVLSVTINQGTASKSLHSVSVTLGSLDPGDDVSIIINTKVNSSLTVSTTVTNIASVTYDSNVVRTASVIYSVIATTTLPGTGETPLFAPARRGNTGALVSLAFPVAAAGYSFWRRKGNKAIVLLGLVISLVILLLVACGGGETPIAGLDEDFAVVQAIPSQTSTPTLLPFMPAYRYSTPEAYPELPDYPVPSPTLMPTGGSEGVEQDASPVTRVVIPGLNLEARVRYVPFEGLSWPVEGLREDVAWLGNTSWPGLGSNTVLAGHVTVQGLGDGPFRYLEELETGDEIVVYTEKGVYTYAVREQMTVDETHLGVTMPTIRPQLTLITCTGWDTELSIYRFRRVVVADLIRNELVERQGKTR